MERRSLSLEKLILSIQQWVRFLPLTVAMIPKPIGGTQHGAYDYVLGVAQALAPSVLGLQGVARSLCYGFAANIIVTNALTKHSLGLKKLVPLQLHGQTEIPIGTLLLVLP